MNKPLKITRIKSGFPKHNYHAWGFDSEFCTKTGQTKLMALTDGEKDYVYSDTSYFDAFLCWVSQLPNYAIIFAHNLAVDLVAMLAGTNQSKSAHWWRRSRLYWSEVDGRFTLDLRLGKPCFGRIIYRNKTIYLRDTSAWYTGKLDQIARDLLGEGKSLIDFLDTTPRELAAYCVRDARLVQRIGQQILAQHQKDNISLCVTGAHQASRAMRKGLKSDLPPLNREQEYYGNKAYYGGRIMAFAKGTIRGDLYKWDLQSAYVGALAQLPGGSLKPCRDLRRWGVYRVEVDVKAPSLPIRDAGGLRYPVGRWEGYYCGIELLAMERAGLGRVVAVRWGWAFSEYSDRPFADACERAVLGRLKEKDNPTLNAAWKVQGNSLYGRMARKGGADYHPIYAALITAWVRARVLGVEGRVLSIQTDSVWLMGNEQAQFANEQEGKPGDWKLEAHCKKLTLIRSACYIPWAGKVPLWEFTKLHGYQGAKPDFIEALTNGRYALSRWIKPAQSTAQQPPNTIRETWARFNCWTPDKKLNYSKLTSGPPERLLREKEYGRPILLEEIANG